MEENLIYNYLEIIEKNFNTDTLDNDNNSSFMWILHERSFFSEEKYNELINSIINIIQFRCKSINNEYSIDFNDLLYKISNIFNWLLEHLVWHYNVEDGFKITNIENFDFSIIGSYIDRFRLVIDSFWKCDIASILDYEDELGKLVEDTENE